MPRPTKFTVDDLLDGALAALVEHGRGASVAQVSASVGAPTGSIYHRFTSRDELFARLWLRSIRRFHSAMFAGGEGRDARQALVDNAAHVVSYTREHPREALAMTLWRQRDLALRGPQAVREEAAAINDEYLAAIHELVEACYGRATPRRMELASLACAEMPYGLVRPYVYEGAVAPRWLEDVARASARAVLALGDDDPTDDAPA
ncbi:MAG: TetR/AcrR family transcriptional regulator [Actinomycetaceae bacterium]|nr:TetR/AcrR family transcriptional regulator [Actinomycetaceae bacterium]